MYELKSVSGTSKPCILEEETAKSIMRSINTKKNTKKDEEAIL